MASETSSDSSSVDNYLSAVRKTTKKLESMTLEEADGPWQSVVRRGKNKEEESTARSVAEEEEDGEEMAMDKFQFDTTLEGWIGHFSTIYSNSDVREILKFIAVDGELELTFGEIKETVNSNTTFRSVVFKCVKGWNNTEELQGIQMDMVHSYAQVKTDHVGHYVKVAVNRPPARRVTLNVVDSASPSPLRFIPRSVQQKALPTPPPPSIHSNSVFPTIVSKAQIKAVSAQPQKKEIVPTPVPVPTHAPVPTAPVPTAPVHAGHAGPVPSPTDFHRQSAAALASAREQGEKVKRAMEEDQAMDTNEDETEFRRRFQEFQFYQYQQFLHMQQQQHYTPPIPPPPPPPQYAPPISPYPTPPPYGYSYMTYPPRSPPYPYFPLGKK